MEDCVSLIEKRRKQPMAGRKLNTKPVHTFHTMAMHERHEASEGRLEPVTDVK